MNINIKTVHFDADQKLEDFVQQRISKLGRFSEDILGAEVTLRVENSQDMENKVAQIRLEIPGNDLFAKNQSKSFEEAADTAVEALRRQLIKYKNKRKG